jgi:hypothetical protein
MPFHHLQKTLCLILGTVSFGVSAANIGTVTLDNGATVLLHDDYTWEYIAINTDADKANKAIPSGVIHKSVESPSNLQQISNNNETSLLRSGLLNSAVKNEVKVTYNDAVWRDDALGLTFKLSSENSQGVVVVQVAVSFYDDNANKISEQTIKVWQSSYRLPETYLRKGETRDSRVIWVEGIKKENWTNKLLSLKVVEVETR